MWKTFYLLSLMLFTFVFPRDRVTRAEPIRADAALVTRDDLSHRKEMRGRTEFREELSDRGIYDEQENSSELVGRWRNNGEALEPQWRDGDTVPLLPFSQFSRYSRDKIDSEDEEDDYGHEGPKYHENSEPEDALHSRSNLRASYPDYGDYESIDRRGYREHEILPRKRNNRLFATQSTGNSRQADKEILRFAENKDLTSTRYQGTFQVHANDYGHELDDEEYLKPRPRKRRPPQNYEFALVENETSSNERELESNSGPWSHTNVKKNPSESESKNSQFLQNAMELKSLLKMQQEEGLSLSELLQRRNLTLSDLLKGKADVINALKSKDSGEGEDYIEEASRMASNSFVKVSAAGKPQWITGVESANIKNSQKKEELRISIIPTDITDPANSTEPAFSTTKSTRIYLEAENATTGKSILATLGPPRTKATPLASAPTIATSLPLPVATNSMESLPSNDSAGKLPNGGEIKAEGLDEDEIMEFSDFTDYKNGRSSMSPVWLMVKDQENDKSTVKGDNDENRGSTLSIEQLLSPTERIKPMKNISTAFENEEQLRVKADQTLTKEGDYSVLSEQEYQDDAPTTYHDLEHNTQVNAPVDENDMSIMEEIESALDAMSRGINFTVESRPGSSKNVPEEDANYLPKNHQNVNTTEKKSYDEIVSEVEPEARAEIFELFASGSAGKRLERLLKSRNMSLEELIALRQRGSSKVHLAEVSRLRIQKPSSEQQTEGGSDSEATTVPSQENLYESGQRNVADGGAASSTEDYKGINVASESTLNPINFVPSEENNGRSHLNSNYRMGNEDSTHDTDYHKNEDEDIKERHRSVEIVDLLTTFGSLPFAKDIQREFAGEYDISDRKKLPEQGSDLGVVFIKDETETININDTSNDIQSGYVKEIVKQEPNSIDIRTVYGQTSSAFDEDEEKNEKGKALSKVKPSIIASGAILGVTIVVFLAIFIICRIRQKQKYRYRNTFSRAVFQGPMLAARKLSNSSSLSTVMVNVVATSTTKRPDKNDIQEPVGDADPRSDIENDSLDANDSWETIPDYMK